MLLIVGGGIAGVSCTEQLAQLCPDEEIVIVSASPLVKACTNFKQLSTVLTDFDVEEKQASYLESTYRNVKVVYGKAAALNHDKNELILDCGRILNYNKICLCTGGKPKVLSQDNPNVIGIRDTETIAVFQKRLRNARTVVIVGNGGIATELVYELENCKIIWAIRDTSIGATFFDAGAAEFFLPHLNGEKVEKEDRVLKRIKYGFENGDSGGSSSNMGGALGPDWAEGIHLKALNDFKNIHVEYNCEVEEILSHCNIANTEQFKDSKDSEWPVYVKLTNGKTYGCDLVVSATGVFPNTDFKFDSSKLNIAKDGGIIINEQMLTSCPDVYAAGDVCSIGWENAKHWFQMRLWTQARQMGCYAAQCIAHNLNGEEKIMDICFDLFTHVTKFFGFKVILLGLYNCQGLDKDYELLLRMTKGSEYIKVVMQDGKMQGAVLIGDTDLEETFENLILNQLDLSRYKEDLLNPDIDIEDYFD